MLVLVGLALLYSITGVVNFRFNVCPQIQKYDMVPAVTAAVPGSPAKPIIPGAMAGARPPTPTLPPAPRGTALTTTGHYEWHSCYMALAGLPGEESRAAARTPRSGGVLEEDVAREEDIRRG